MLVWGFNGLRRGFLWLAAAAAAAAASAAAVDLLALGCLDELRETPGTAAKGLSLRLSLVFAATAAAAAGGGGGGAAAAAAGAAGTAAG